MSKRKAGTGQVVVEMLLVLPVFFTIIFTIMDMGNLAFQVILLNHATYEVARVAGMTRAGPVPSIGGSPRGDCNDLRPLMTEIITSATVECSIKETLQDPQVEGGSFKNYDVLVTGTLPVTFMFPLSSMLLSSPIVCPRGPGGGKCLVSTTVRMPVERPLPN